jgi:hypothetical protein
MSARKTREETPPSVSGEAGTLDVAREQLHGLLHRINILESALGTLAALIDGTLESDGETTTLADIGHGLVCLSGVSP